MAIDGGYIMIRDGLTIPVVPVMQDGMIIWQLDTAMSNDPMRKAGPFELLLMAAWCKSQEAQTDQ